MSFGKVSSTARQLLHFFATTAADGKTYQVEYFNLDAIISVGYRVNSKRGTQFRIWATRILRDHLLLGYSVNQRRLQELKQSLRVVGQVLDRYDVSARSSHHPDDCRQRARPTRDPDPHHRRTHQRSQLIWQSQVERDRPTHGSNQVS